MLVVTIGHQKFLLDEDALFFIRSTKKVEERYLGRTVYEVKNESAITAPILIVNDSDLVYEGTEDLKNLELKKAESDIEMYKNLYNNSRLRVQELEDQLKKERGN
ncbi:MAG: hypothetical protein BWY21_01345 [Parcubacteria group bacterium ADurb.Bin216]|nr:MAG: hypothetical protein BWY21_01345 [Parcubacteria group bacterium ADurb.Bin216]